MRGHLLLVVCGATIAVGALGAAATAAYAAPLPASSRALPHSPALVVPANYHPSFSTEGPVAPASKGLVSVAPNSAVHIAPGPLGKDSKPNPAPKPPAAPAKSQPGSPNAAPPKPGPPAGNKATPKDGNNAGPGGPGIGPAPVEGPGKGDGSNKGSGSNSGSDGKNKGDESSKGKGKGKPGG
jgi:hypothetical protein